MMCSEKTIGEHLREWRRRRRLSQLDLACDAGISARHLSFVETGRARPSRDMVLHLAERLELPLRERNSLLLSAGFAPAFTHRPLADPAMRVAREALESILRAHEPFPALAIDRHWNLVAANRAVAPLIARSAPVLLQPPVNVLRLSLHPDGLAPRTANLREWRTHLLARLSRQVETSADPILTDLLRELSDYPGGVNGSLNEEREAPEIAIPLRLITEKGTLSFLSATMMFGTPIDITLSELAIEILLPANSSTAEALRDLLSGCSSRPAREESRLSAPVAV